MKGSLGKVWVVSIPMRTAFRGVKHREALIIQGERFAEWSPFLEYEDQEAATWLKGAFSWANDPLPTLVRDQISINATLPAVTPDEVADVLLQFGKFRTVKIKVAAPGEGLAQDMARIETVRTLYPEAKLRLDANGGYTIAQALQMAEQLNDFNLEYLEQPVQTIAEMAQLRKQLAGSGVKIAADESIRKSADPQEVMRAGAADIVMLKAQPLGGVAASLDIANSLGLEVVVSSALETSLGISQGLYLAGALPELNYDCGLGTLNLFSGDIVQQSLIPSDSVLDVRVVQPDLDLLEKFAASEERTSWWEARLARCLELNT